MKLFRQKNSKIYALWGGTMAMVLVFWLWHMTDVQASVQQNGHTWLWGWYAGLLLLAAIVLTALGFISFVRKRPTEQVFLCAGFGIGTLFLLVMAPLSAPDEMSHFLTACQLSSHMLGQPANAPDGRVYLRGEDAFIEDLEDVMKDDGTGAYTAGKEKDAVILGQQLTEHTYQLIHDLGLWGRQKHQDAPAISYHPPVRTTPLAYIPQASGISLARLLSMNGLGLLYLGRFFNLAFFSAMGCLTIRRIPFGKEAVCGVLLLPMTLHLAASLSYDVMIISLSAYFTAVCLDLAYRAERVRPLDILALALIMAVMGPCKMVYGIIMGFCLLIPVRKFGSLWRWLLSAAIVLGAYAMAMYFVNNQTVAMYANASEGYIGWADEAGYTFTQLVHTPVLVFKMFYNTLMWEGETLCSTMFGSALGNMDGVLNTPYIVILCLAFLLLMLASRHPGESLLMPLTHRLWVWFLCLACLGALMFSMLLAWTPVTSSVIRGVQGRYLLPVLPILLLTLKNDLLVRTSADDGFLLYLIAAMDVYTILRIFAIVCLRI